MCKGAQTYVQGLPASTWHAAARRAGLPSLHPVFKSSQPLAFLCQQQQLHRDIAAAHGLASCRHSLARGDAAVSPDLRLCAYVDAHGSSPTGAYMDKRCRVVALGGAQLASCVLRAPPLLAQNFALSWAPGMQAIASVDNTSLALHLMAWFGGVQSLVLQHTVHLHRSAFQGHAFLQWAPDASSFAVFTNNFALHALNVWLFTSQGKAVFHWASQPGLRDTLWYICPTCSPDSAAFAALSYWNELQPLTRRVCVAHRRGVHHVPVPAKVRSLHWAPEAGAICRVLICHLSDKCMFVDCAPDVPVKAAVHIFGVPADNMATGLTHIAVVLAQGGLQLLRMQPGFQLVQVAQVPLAFGLDEAMPVLSFSPTGAHLAVAIQPLHGAARRCTLAIYAVKGTLLVSERVDGRMTLISMMGAQLPWASCGWQLAGYVIDVHSKAKPACTVFGLRTKIATGPGLSGVPKGWLNSPAKPQRVCCVHMLVLRALANQGRQTSPIGCLRPARLVGCACSAAGINLTHSLVEPHSNRHCQVQRPDMRFNDGDLQLAAACALCLLAHLRAAHDGATLHVRSLRLAGCATCTAPPAAGLSSRHQTAASHPPGRCLQYSTTRAGQLQPGDACCRSCLGPGTLRTRPRVGPL